MACEELYLQDIIEAANTIEHFLKDVSKEEFLASELLRSAVLHKLTIIGEAAARISNDLKSCYPNVE